MFIFVVVFKLNSIPVTQRAEGILRRKMVKVTMVPTTRVKERFGSPWLVAPSEIVQ